MENELPENFCGDCKLLQERLRRFKELHGEGVEELSNGHIKTEMGDGADLTLYSGPKFFVGSPSAYYGEIYWRRRLFCRHEYINEMCAQAIYEELNIAIKEMEVICRVKENLSLSSTDTL